jgi:hypothetical protein
MRIRTLTCVIAVALTLAGVVGCSSPPARHTATALATPTPSDYGIDWSTKAAGILCPSWAAMVDTDQASIATALLDWMRRHPDLTDPSAVVAKRFPDGDQIREFTQALTLECKAAADPAKASLWGAAILATTRDDTSLMA